MNAENLLHPAAVVATAWVVTYLLRAFPFLLFGGGRKTPAGVAAFGRVISPLVIAGLVVYSYCGLECRLAAPWAAGALTVALQLGFRSALLSILGGTALYMTLLHFGV